MRILIITVSLALSANTLLGSVRRVEISKETHKDAPINFSVTVRPERSHPECVSVEIVIPPDQKELEDLWKVYLWIIRDGTVVFGAPMEQSHAKDRAITVRQYGHVDVVGRSIVAIRCGKQAPAAETIYQIDIGSYLSAKVNDGPPVADENPRFEFRPEPPPGIPAEAKLQQTGSTENHGSLKQLLGESLESVNVRHFSTEWKDERSVQEYLVRLFASTKTKVFTRQLWSQGVQVPEIECVLKFRNGGNGKLLIWNTAACFRDAAGKWWFLSVYDHFHRNHPKGNRKLIQSGSD